MASLELGNFVLRMLYVIALSRLLAPADYGFFTYAQTFALSFLPLILLGMDAKLPLEIGRHGAAAREMMLDIFSLRLILSAAVIVIAGAAALSLEAGFQAKMGLLIACFCLLPRGLHMYSGNVFTGFEKVRIMARTVFFFRTLEVVAGTVLLLCGAGVLVLLLLHVFCWSAQSFLCLRFVHRHFVPLAFVLRPAKWRRWLLGEHLWLAAQLLFFYLLSNTAFLLYRHLSDDAHAFGQIALAFQAVTLACGTLSALLAGSVPVMVRSFQRRDGKDGLFTLAASLCMIAAGYATYGLLLVLGDWLIHLCFGSAYAFTGQIIAAMALWLPWAAAVQPLQRYLFVRGRTDLTTFNYLLGWLISIVILWQRHEQSGAAAMMDALLYGYASACFASALCGLYLRQSERRAAKNP